MYDEAESIIISDQEIILIILDLSLPRTKDDYQLITSYRRSIRSLREQCRNNSSDSDLYFNAQERIITANEIISDSIIRRGGIEMINGLLKEMRTKNNDMLMKFPIPIIFISGWDTTQESIGWTNDMVFDHIQLGKGNFEDLLIIKIKTLLRIIPSNNPA